MLSMIMREKGAKEVQRSVERFMVNTPIMLGSSSWPGEIYRSEVSVIA